MKKTWHFWLPRILALLFVGVISLFAFDVFDGESQLGEMILGFIVHLTPTYVLLALLLIAWKWPLPGGILFVLMGASYYFLASDQHWSANLIVAGTPILIGLLFITEFILNTKSQPMV